MALQEVFVDLYDLFPFQYSEFYQRFKDRGISVDTLLGEKILSLDAQMRTSMFPRCCMEMIDVHLGLDSAHHATEFNSTYRDYYLGSIHLDAARVKSIQENFSNLGWSVIFVADMPEDALEHIANWCSDNKVELRGQLETSFHHEKTGTQLYEHLYEKYQSKDRPQNIFRFVLHNSPKLESYLSLEGWFFTLLFKLRNILGYLTTVDGYLHEGNLTSLNSVYTALLKKPSTSNKLGSQAQTVDFSEHLNRECPVFEDVLELKPEMNSTSYAAALLPRYLHHQTEPLPNGLPEVMQENKNTKRKRSGSTVDHVKFDRKTTCVSMRTQYFFRRRPSQDNKS